MYIPHQYKNENLAEVKDFIRQNAFGILVSQHDGQLLATHIPLELEKDQNGKDMLLGHISRANPQWRGFGEGQRVLCIFNGPHSYVSSSWYKEEDVPTWDYIAVHIYGLLSILDETGLYDSLDKLMHKYEKHSKNPVVLSELSKKTMRQIKGIVGFRISVDQIQAAYKLSQGRPGDHARIISELRETGDAGAIEVARAIATHAGPQTK